MDPKEVQKQSLSNQKRDPKTRPVSDTTLVGLGPVLGPFCGLVLGSVWDPFGGSVFGRFFGGRLGAFWGPRVRFGLCVSGSVFAFILAVFLGPARMDCETHGYVNFVDSITFFVDF